MKEKPLLAIIHGTFGRGEMLFKNLPVPIALYAYILERLIPFIYKNVPFITATNGSSLKNKLLALGLAVPNIKFISAGIDNNLYRPKTMEDERPLVLYIGRVTKYKQIDHLVQSFKIVKEEIPDAKTIIAGRGGYREISELIKNLGLDSSIDLMGEVSEEEKVRLLQRAWVFVIPSMNEGWGFVVTEANACGTPAIAYNVPGLNDSIKNEETGLLVSYGDIKELAQATVRVLRDEKLRKKLSINAQNWASKFNWDSSAKEFVMELERIVTQEDETVC